MGNACVAEGHKVINGELCTREIIASDGVDAWNAVCAPGDDRGRHFACDGREVVIGEAVADEHQALHPGLEQARNLGPLDRRVGIARDEQRRVVVGAYPLLHTVEDLREDRVVQVEDVYADGVGALEHEIARRAIGAVAEFVGCGEDRSATGLSHLG